MRTKAITELFVGTYGLARRSRLLEMDWARRGFVASAFLYKRFYEDPFWGLVRRNPRLFEGGDVLDLGANIGYTACVFAPAVRPAAKVYAFEPDPWTYALLKDVIRRRDLSGKIEPLNMATGSSQGYLEFWHNKKHSADHRVVTDQFRRTHPDAKDFLRVPVTSVDRFVIGRKLSQISFIKIDVQGYELSVCQGMQGTLERFPEICICLEFSPHDLVELGFDPGQLLEFFRVREYRVYVLNRDSLEPVSGLAAIESKLGGTDYVDLLCSKREVA
jgi:FkbM family methyltransferase